MTPAELRAAFPAFKNATDPQIQFALDSATARTDAEVWGTLQSQGITFLALHFLSIDAGAKHMRKDFSGAMENLTSTAYGRERKALQNIVSSGYRVAKSGL